MDIDKDRGPAGHVRPCRPDERAEVLRIVNAAAEAYRGVIPPDRWHDPYMGETELAADIAGGVAFAGFDTGQGLAGIMGLQPRLNVTLIRHAYVLPAWQGRGVGSALLAHLRGGRDGPVLVGTWRAAAWAVRFYERHGFARVPEDAVAPLLRTYWDIPDRQVETSLVLASPPLAGKAAGRLIAAARAG